MGSEFGQLKKNSPWAVCLWLQWSLLSHCRLNPPDWFCWPNRVVQKRSKGKHVELKSPFTSPIVKKKSQC